MKGKSFKWFVLILTLGWFQVAIAATTQQKDSAQKILLAKAVSLKSGKTLLRAANVAYPELFKDEMDVTADYVEKFAEDKRSTLIHLYNKGKGFLPQVLPILKKQNVPVEFALLMALESAFNSNARSPMGAVGYWQFMPTAAKEYGLKIYTSPKTKKLVDERKNLLKSTIAAANYFKDKQQALGGDWLLTAASYNCGLGNVKKAIRKSNKANPDFWDIKPFLPKETQAYVLKFIAINVIFNNYESFLEKDLLFQDIFGTLPLNYQD